MSISHTEDEFDWDAFMRDVHGASMATVGAWVFCLAKMRLSVTRGRISWPLSTYARLFGTSLDQAKAIIDEIGTLGIGDAVTESNGDVTLVNRRMHRAYLTAENNRKRQEKHRKSLKNAAAGDARNGSVTNEQKTRPSSLKKGEEESNEEKKEEKRGGRKKAERDIRLDHPAIVATLNVCGKHPFKDLWDTIIETIGVNPDQDLLKRCWVTWRSRGYKPTNFAWILEWYPAGGPPTNGGYGTNQHRGPKPTNREKLDRTAEIISQYPTEAELEARRAAVAGEDGGGIDDYQQAPPS